MGAVKRISGADLIQQLQSEPDNKPIIFDVRDEDYQGGHIKGAINIHSDSFRDDDQVDEIIAEHLKAVQSVVLHCAQSQVRGPFCAKRLASRLAATEPETPVEVHILQGGFNLFSQTYRNSKPDLFADMESTS